MTLGYETLFSFLTLVSAMAACRGKTQGLLLSVSVAHTGGTPPRTPPLHAILPVLDELCSILKIAQTAMFKSASDGAAPKAQKRVINFSYRGHGKLPRMALESSCKFGRILMVVFDVLPIRADFVSPCSSPLPMAQRPKLPKFQLISTIEGMESWPASPWSHRASLVEL